jgi:hypothetical protein
VLFTPGESAAADYTGYLTNRTLTGLFAKENDGAVILLERMSCPLNKSLRDLLGLTLPAL